MSLLRTEHILFYSQTVFFPNLFFLWLSIYVRILNYYMTHMGFENRSIDMVELTYNRCMSPDTHALQRLYILHLHILQTNSRERAPVMELIT
jgi:hypothetical protein